jgi:hypothetical protein
VNISPENHDEKSRFGSAANQRQTPANMLAQTPNQTAPQT